MIIISQDRHLTINFDNVAAMDSNMRKRPLELVVTFGNGNGLSVGKFKDQATLDKVVDGIVKAYIDGVPVACIPDECFSP